MTTPTTRLAEIAERQAEQQAFEAWAREASPFAGSDGRLYAHAGFKAGWSAQLTAAQARSREDAEIMRRAASGVESHNMVEWPGESGVSLRCNICGAPDDIELGPKHTEQCFVTKLRARADELGGAG